CAVARPPQRGHHPGSRPRGHPAPARQLPQGPPPGLRLGAEGSKGSGRHRGGRPMRCVRVLAVLVALASALGTPRPALAQEVAWRKDYASALQEALEKKLPLVLDFGTQDCFWCKKLDENTFRDAAVVAALNGRFVPVKIDAAQYKSLVQHLNIQSYPTLVVAAPGGKILATQNGFLEPAPFLDFLQRGLAQAAPAPAAPAPRPAPPVAPPPAWMAQEF